MKDFLKIFFSWSIEFGPIVGFFIVLAIRGETNEGFVDSTALFVILTVIALVAAYVKDKRIALFPLVTGASVVLFGIATVLFHNPLIFILKDTFYNGLFAVVLFAGVMHGRGFLKSLFSSLFDMTDRGWYVLSVRWATMFFLLAFTNEIVWRNFSEQAWVVYKFVATIATIVFGFYQITLARRERNETASAWGMRINPPAIHY